MTTDQIITSIGAFFAAVAAVAAAWRLRYARATVSIAKDAETVAERTLAEAERSRIQAERDRKRDHLQQIGTVIEAIFWEGAEGTPMGQAFTPMELRWFNLRNQLASLMVGYDDELPVCERVRLATASENAPASDAREEVLRAIEGLTGPASLPSA